MDITINHTGPNGQTRTVSVQRIVYLPQERTLRVAAGFGPQEFEIADDHPIAVALQAFVAEKFLA